MMMMMMMIMRRRRRRRRLRLRIIMRMMRMMMVLTMVMVMMTMKMMTMMLTMLELSLRNKMIRLGLFMEMGAVALGSGAVVGGVFGMNLTHGLEEHPAAFMVTLGGISLVMTTIFAGKHPPSQYHKIQIISNKY